MSTKLEGAGSAAGDDVRLKRDFGTIGLLFTAIGSIIGSGWLFSSLHASSQAGPASIISWIVGTIMFLFIGLSYAEVGVMFPRSGGVARYPHYAWGSFASYSAGWVTWLACAAVAAVEVSAVLTYATSYLHWLENKDATLTGVGLVVAILLMALFVGINYLGVKWFARINNVLVWWKLGMMVLVIVAIALVAFHPGNFTIATKDGSGFAPYGLQSAFEAIPAAGIAFSFLGWRQGIELAGETRNPKRNVPLTLIGSVVICGVLYILLQIIFIGAQDPAGLAKHGWHDVGALIVTGSDAGNFSPLATLATVLGLGWLAGLLYADAFISPGDTGLIYTGVTARMSYAMARNKNAPAALGKVNKNGVPWVSLILAWVVGCIFFLPFPRWQALVGIVTSLTVLSFGIGSITLLTFRKQIPEVERPYRAKWPWVIVFLALLSTNLIMYWSGWDQVWKMMGAVVLGYIILGILELVDRGPKRRAPKLDFKHGWWVLLWFAGITLVSYLGSYSGTSTAQAGQANVYGFNGAIIANIILTIVVLAVAWYCQLPGDRVREILAEPEAQVEGSAAEAH
ncbi:APC family permease [Humibacter antri]